MLDRVKSGVKHIYFSAPREIVYYQGKWIFFCRIFHHDTGESIFMTLCVSYLM